MTCHIPSFNPLHILIPKPKPATDADPLALIPPSSMFNSNIPVEASSAYPPLEPNLYREFNNVAENFCSAFAKCFKRHEDITMLDSLTVAIVPVQEEEEPIMVSYSRYDASPSLVTQRPKPQERSLELVRITDVGPKGEKQFREVVSKTRMIYDSLRIFLILENQREGFGIGRRIGRPDSKAASMMKKHLLWLNRDKCIVGSIPGVQVGDIFFFRLELCVMGLHGQTQAGIDYFIGSRSSNGSQLLPV